VAHRDGSGASPGNFLSIREHTDTMIDLRGVVGFTGSRHFMPYVTGGWFYEHGHYDGQFHDATPSDFILRDGTGRGGWTIGGGLACRLNRIWVLKAEYLYYDVGHHVAATAPIGGRQSQFDFGGTGSLARLALTVRVP
jgi:opacity protein-like surface antigen